MDKKELKEGQTIILSIIDTFPSLEEINTDNDNEEIFLSFNGKDLTYNLTEIINNNKELHYKLKSHSKNNFKIFLIKNNSLFASGIFSAKTGDQWVTFSYENKKKANNNLALSLINCIKLKFLCKIEHNPCSTSNSENDNNTNTEFSFSRIDASNKKNNNNGNVKTTVSQTLDEKFHHKTPKNFNNNRYYKNNNNNKNNPSLHSQNTNNTNYTYFNNELMQSMSTNNVVKEKLILPHAIKSTNQINKFSNVSTQSEQKKTIWKSQSKRTRCSYDNVEKMKTESVHSLPNNYGIAGTLENALNKNKKNTIKRKKSKSNLDSNKNKIYSKIEDRPKTSYLSKMILEKNNNENEKNLNNEISNIKIKDKYSSNNNSKNISINGSEKNIFIEKESKKIEIEKKEEVINEEMTIEKEEEVKKEEDQKPNDSSIFNENTIDNYSSKLDDFHLLYNDEYFLNINKEDLALEIEFYIEKFIELVSEYHVQIKEKELEYQLIKNIYKENISLYKEMKKIIKKLNNIKENCEFKHNSSEFLNKDHDKNNKKNLNTNNNEINFFNFLIFSGKEAKIKENKENLKKIVKNLLNKEKNKKILLSNEKSSKWVNENSQKINNKGLKSKNKNNYSNKTLNYNKNLNKKKNEAQAKTLTALNKAKSKNKYGKNTYKNGDNKRK